jgi:DNA-binding transcriptional regulator YhcF (GntR family)
LRWLTQPNWKGGEIPPTFLKEFSMLNDEMISRESLDEAIRLLEEQGIAYSIRNRSHYIAAQVISKIIDNHKKELVNVN